MNGPDAYWTRAEVARYAEAWSQQPEGIAGSPIFAVRFTPAGLLAFMDLAHLPSIEATLAPTEPAVTSGHLPAAPDSLLRRIEAHEASVGLVEARSVSGRAG